MTLWTAEEARAATGGTGLGGWAATGVSIDSRTLRPGDLFVALEAQRDGHDFVAAALGRGAAAALVSRRPEGVAEGAPLLVVPDVLRGLEALGRAGRARARARVVAVTGSAGKTSTKEMLRAALAPSGRVHAAEASHNNHWGVPLTLARLPADAGFAVVEVGMSGPGEIAPLARMARPHVAVVTTVGAAHLAAFEDVAGIAREKASIVEGLEPGGAAVLPADLAETPILLAAARARGARVVTFGAAPGADWRLLGDGGAEAAGQGIDLRLAAEGRHFALNALATLAAAAALGAGGDAALRALPAWAPPKGRGAREALPWGGGTITLIDDAFNANPASMAAGLAVLAGAQARRRVAILGDMLELGAGEAALHAGLAADPSMGAVARVHAVGPRMRALHDALPPGRRGEWAAAPEDLVPRLPELLEPGDAVLVKGSKGSRVSRIVDAVRDLGQGAAPRAPGGVAGSATGAAAGAGGT